MDKNTANPTENSSLDEASSADAHERQVDVDAVLAYLASCKTSDEIDASEINRSSADEISRCKEEERIARDEAILNARAFANGDQDANANVNTKLYEALEIAASMIDTPIARRRLNIDGNDSFLKIIRNTLGKFSDLRKESPATTVTDRKYAISTKIMDLFDSLNPENVNIQPFPREDLGDSGAVGDDVLAECILYGYKGGDESWNNSNSSLGEKQIAWAIRLGRALEKSERESSVVASDVPKLASSMLAKRGRFPSDGTVPYDIARDLIAEAIDPTNAPPSGELKALLENLSSYKNDKDSTLANFARRAHGQLNR